MKVYEKIERKARRLVEKLQNSITDGSRKICENYGQREIHAFINKELSPLSNGQLTYSEECNIKDILYKVSNIR